MAELLPKNGIQMVYGNFEDLPDLLRPHGAFVSLAHANRSTSHLEDYYYAQAVGTLACYLRPGGLIVDDGFRESYSFFCRIKVLRHLAKQLGESYFIGLIGDDSGPKSAIISRRRTDGSHFFDENRSTLLEPKGQLVPLIDYERTWPRHALRNLAIGHVKEYVFNQQRSEVIRGNVSPNEAYESVVHHPLFVDIAVRMTNEMEQMGLPKKTTFESILQVITGPIVRRSPGRRKRRKTLPEEKRWLRELVLRYVGKYQQK
ncbi:hypothetical protein IPJ72_05945 [Candidatus Peregrinibacteria bacterium]|nr:MAG: hypothetical protein IPJ72_05945 [Candidatus Peregrinibacteria bacterium]